MATFEDQTGRTWSIKLSAPLIHAVREDFRIDLVNLEKDPLSQMRNDPMVLVDVVEVLCREEISRVGLSPTEFAEKLPVPPDPMLEAVREAIIDFFPTGRASHVREVLAGYDSMAEKADAIVAAKMDSILKDPKLHRRMKESGDRIFERAIAEAFEKTTGLGT